MNNKIVVDESLLLLHRTLLTGASDNTGTAFLSAGFQASEKVETSLDRGLYVNGILVLLRFKTSLRVLPSKPAFPS